MLPLPLLSSATPSLRALEQLLLAGILPVGPPTDGLFFAIFPDPMAAASLMRLACHLRAKYGLSGAPIATSRIHLTLHHLGHYHGLRRDHVEMAVEAAAKITARPFQVTFDRALSFRRNSVDRPLVLRSSARAAALKKFQQDLGAALKKTGLGRKVTRSFTPHVTLLYDQQNVVEQAVETIGWTVSEFALVHSLIGQTKHVVLARWPLRADQGPVSQDIGCRAKPGSFDHDRIALSP
jgi:2'-5' RNA ligase